MQGIKQALRNWLNYTMKQIVRQYSIIQLDMPHTAL